MGLATILLADDEATLRNNLAEVLREEGYDVIACPDGSEALRALKHNTVDAVITDLRMPGICGMDLIEHVRKLAPEAVILVMTAFGEVETAVETMKRGARDYLCKPLIFDELIFKLKQLLAADALARENQLLRQQIRESHDFSGIVGQSPAILAIIDTIKRIAHTSSNVLICGESGTGKEVLARALHYSGITQDKPFVAVNCGGLTDTLVESELFGYRRGAFTGAETDHAGYFEAANGGTLFLDEIGNFPLPSQAVLLRAIEKKAVTRVGESRPRPVNIRIIAATNRDLEKAIEAGEFREDLYYRLNVIRITLPPLRERTEDIPPAGSALRAEVQPRVEVQLPGVQPRGARDDAGSPLARQRARTGERSRAGAHFRGRSRGGTPRPVGRRGTDRRDGGGVRVEPARGQPRIREATHRPGARHARRQQGRRSGSPRNRVVEPLSQDGGTRYRAGER